MILLCVLSCISHHPGQAITLEKLGLEAAG
jgi:hypothetical protein